MNETMHAIREPVEAWFRRIEEQRSSSAGEPRPVAEDVTVVIKTLGREILRQALRSIAVGEVLPARVVVVHQGDDERVCKWAEELSGALTVEYVADERRRAAAGINRGLERVRTRFVALTDDDCVDAVDWIARLAERLRAEP
ncbi:MAG: glycosyltransferase family 2 protein, partial [Gemmatimonadota bacterium]